jgi:hypothetical protein
VDATNQDIVHAYRAVFERERETTDPVLVFEDDARLVSRTARRDLARVDRFVAKGEFSLYTLGSIGAMLPHGGWEHWRFVGGVFGCAHAVIYSPSAVRDALAMEPGPLGHIDASVLAQMPLKLTYHRPIAYQVFDVKHKSENSGTWCVRCDGGVLDSAVRRAAWAYFGAVGLDTERGWLTMYELHKLAPPLAVCFVATMLGVLVFAIVKKRSLYTE